MRQFESQIRLQKWQIDEAKRHLADLTRLSERLTADLAELDSEMAHERKAAKSLEAGVTLQAYLARCAERRSRLLESIADIDAKTDEARDALRESFAALKRVEIAAETAAERQRLQMARRNQASADELSLTMFRRRAAAHG